jgi:hypothetical protein
MRAGRHHQMRAVFDSQLCVPRTLGFGRRHLGRAKQVAESELARDHEQRTAGRRYVRPRRPNAWAAAVSNHAVPQRDRMSLLTSSSRCFSIRAAREVQVMPPTLSSTLACDVVTARVDSWPRRWLLGSDRPVNLVPVAVALEVSVQEALAAGAGLRRGLRAGHDTFVAGSPRAFRGSPELGSPGVGGGRGSSSAVRPRRRRAPAR